MACRSADSPRGAPPGQCAQRRAAARRDSQDTSNTRRFIMIRNALIALFLSLAIAQAGLAEDMTVDINTASAEQLAEVLDGVGPAKSEAIVAYREENGDFTHIDELVNVRGIGLRTVDQNRDRIDLDGEAAAEG
nr:helix-hairpin-helix domain-containing protein [Wenzhouxiangella sediminis]